MMNSLKYRAKVLKMIFKHAYGVKHFFVIACIVSVFIMVTSLTIPAFYQLFINEVIFNGRLSFLYIVCAGYLVAFVLNTVFSYLKLYCENRFGQITIFKIRYKIWKNMFLREFTSYETQNPSDMNMRIGVDLEKLKPFVVNQTIDYIIGLLTFISTAVLLIVINPLLALFASIVIPVSFWLSEIICRKEEFYVKSMRESNIGFSDLVHESAHNWREIKALGLERHEKIRFVELAKKWAYANSHFINFCVLRVDVIPKIQNEFIMQFLIYFIGGLFILNGNLTIGELFVFTKYYDMLSDSVKKLATLKSEFQISRSHIDKVMEELSLSFPKRRLGRLPDEKITSVQLDKVHFTYPGVSDEVLSSVNLSVNAGQKVAIIGRSGCGKSTILKMISGLIEPSGGKVFISGENLEQMDLDSVHEKLGFIMQDNILFNDTIKENLLYGKSNASDEEIKNACMKACIYDFVIGLPNGFNTVIGERGIKLSGGQKQRIILARTFLRDPDLYLFDEATSALDQYSESIIYDALRAIECSKTVIVVAHRQSSIDLCEIKYEMRDGMLRNVE